MTWREARIPIRLLNNSLALARTSFAARVQNFKLTPIPIFSPAAALGRSRLGKEQRGSEMCDRHDRVSPR